MTMRTTTFPEPADSHLGLGPYSTHSLASPLPAYSTEALSLHAESGMPNMFRFREGDYLMGRDNPIFRRTEHYSGKWNISSRRPITVSYTHLTLPTICSV